MDLEAIVKHGNGRAGFRIHRESPGIYNASLMFFDGDLKSTPPHKITLVRGIRQWAGSYEHPDLLSELGKIIEEALIRSTASGTPLR